MAGDIVSEFVGGIDVGGIVSGGAMLILFAVGIIFIIAFVIALNKWKSFNEDVLIETNPRKAPRYGKFKITKHKGKDVYELRGDFMSTMLGKTTKLPQVVKTRAGECLRLEEILPGEYQFLTAQQMKDRFSDSEWSSGEVDKLLSEMSKEELKSLQRYRFIPFSSLISGMKFTEVMDVDVKNEMIDEDFDSDLRLTRPAGFLDKWAMPLMFVLALCFVWLMTDGSNKTATAANSLALEASKNYKEGMVSMSNGSFAETICPNWCAIQASTVSGSGYVYGKG